MVTANLKAQQVEYSKWKTKETRKLEEVEQSGIKNSKTQDGKGQGRRHRTSKDKD